MLASLRRHPFPVAAFFRYSLVLTYALPPSLLRPLLPPGLELDGYEDQGFLAIALVQTEGLRPAGWPALLGRSFFLSGYRIFTRFQQADGKLLRGLRILRSDTDSWLMARMGNLLTHYNYQKGIVHTRRDAGKLEIEIRTPGGAADLALCADLASTPTAPPPGSPFPDWATARHFAGPLPYTFDYESEADSMVVIQGVRQHWQPRPVSVEVRRCTYFERPEFSGVRPILANAFLVENVPYRWERGVFVRLRPEAS